jgi:acyl-CoA thioester hydrolase
MAAEPTLAKELETSATIRFQDCDPFRHLNNARYIDYFMNAREDQLIQFYNFSIFDFSQQTDHAWVVTKSQIAYLSPAMMQEQVIIRTRLIEMSESLLVVEGMMLDKAGRRLKAATWIEFAFINLLTGRTAQHPGDLMELFRAVVVDEPYQAEGFNQRVNSLKQQFRREAVPGA